jgi:hypothetical protein
MLLWLLNALALTFGAALGARALFDPHWAARLVRLREDGAGGFAEFRATYGGVFLGLHLIALAFTLKYVTGGENIAGALAVGAAAALSVGWAGAAFGRIVSMWRDGADTPFNRISAGVECAMAALIGGPLAAWFVFG